MRCFLSSRTAFSLPTRSPTVVQYCGGFHTTSPQNSNTYAAAVPGLHEYIKSIGQKHIYESEAK